MTEISAGMVKELREKTGAGMLDCRNALSETGGNMEKAVEQLRKKGIASADKKAGRLASEGLIHIHCEGNRASLVEVNCETDFVGKNEDFQNFVKNVAGHVHQHKPKNLEELLAQKFKGADKSVEMSTKDMVAKIGENISVRRFVIVEAAAGEAFGTYTHMGNKIGAVVRVRGDVGKLDPQVLKGLAMHVAAAAPRFLKREEIPEEVKHKEREIYLSQLKDSGKPAEILEKIVEGKIHKFITEVCYVDQIYIKDPEGKNSVNKYLKKIDPSAEIIEFVRFQVGEGMAKKQEDFAAEVANVVNSL
jgi:elongation factor Ts